jgi:hypothetical protein
LKPCWSSKSSSFLVGTGCGPSSKVSTTSPGANVSSSTHTAGGAADAGASAADTGAAAPQIHHSTATHAQPRASINLVMLLGTTPLRDAVIRKCLEKSACHASA